MANYTFYVTVSGGKFLIDGVSQQTVDLGHNLTYRFDQSDSSNGAGGTHPLRFSTTSDGTHGGGSALGSGDGVTTNGTPGSSGAYTEIAVTSSTTNPLYYYCSNHSGMGGQANTTSAEFANTTGVALKKPILANATDKWGQFSNQNLDTIAGKLPQSFVFPTGTGGNNQVILSDGSGGTSWGDVALTPEIQGVTWYSDSGYSSTLSASEAINIDDATYLKVTGQNFGSSGVFGGNAYVQIINTTQSNAVVGNNQSGLTGCVTSASHQSDAEVRFTINPSGVSGISSGDTLKVKFVTGGGESLFATGYVVSADPTSVTTVNSATISNTASVGSFGGTVAGGGEDSNTKLLLNFDRTGGTDIEDSSNTGGDGHKITATNASIKSSPFGDGKSAMFFDGTDDYLTGPTDHDDFDFGNGDFTIECWVWLNSWANDRYQSIVGNWNNTYAFDFRTMSTDASGNVAFIYNNGTANTLVDSGFRLQTYHWHHLAVSRESTNLRIFVDGDLKTTHNIGTATLRDTSSATLMIGRMGSVYHDGYADEIRIVKNTAVYTGNFTVPTSRLSATQSNQGTNIADITGTATKLLIHCDTEYDSSGNKRRITHNATNMVQEAVTGRSAWGNSAWKHVSNGFLSVPASSDLAFGTGNFTIEAWINLASVPASKCIGFDQWGSSDGSFQPFWVSSSNKWNWIVKVSGSNYSAQHDTSVQTGWAHYAVVRNGNSMIGYINGVAGNTLDLSSISSTNIGLSTQDWLIGRDSTSASYDIPNGSYFQDLRVVKGTAVYTGAFNNSLPSGPLTTTGGTYTQGSDIGNVNTSIPSGHCKLLMPGDGGVFDDSSTSDHDITPTGSYHSQAHGGIAPALTFPASLKSTGSAGINLNGSGQYLTIHDFSVSASSAFTFECWFYNPSNSAGHLYDWRPSDGSTNGNWIQLSANAFSFRNISGNNNSAISYPPNQWNHIAYTRDGSGNWYFYLNGKKMVNGTGDTSALSSRDIYFGRRYSSGTSDNLENAFIDGIKFSTAQEYSGTNSSSDWSNYLGSSGTTAWNQPTKIYGAFKSDTIDTITLTGTAGTGGGYVTFNNATLSGNTETTSALPAGLTLNEAESTDNTATITGNLTASSGQHAINLVARATSDGTNANIDPNRKQAYSHTIDKGSGGTPVLFNARRYVGNSTNRSINGLGFKSGLVWIKGRDYVDNHQLFDSVRGVSKTLHPNTSASEVPANQYGYLDGFSGDGFSLKGGTNANAHYATNHDGQTYISWAFKAAGAPSSSALSLSGGVGAGTIANDATGVSGVTSITQSVNQNSGFSITKYTGAGASGMKFPHNLGGTPDWVIIKRITDGTRSWVVWHSGLTGATNTGDSAPSIYLDLNNAQDTAHSGERQYGYIDPPTSTEIRLTKHSSGTNYHSVGHTSTEYICYAWKSVSGVSEFGAYTGTGGANTITYDNSNSFTARFLMVKRTNSNDNWTILDSFRDSTTEKTTALFANTSGADTPSSTYGITFTTTGFTMDSGSTSGHINTNGGYYIFMAFA